jgi:acetyl-CoA C-acetyltransferase
MALLGPLPKPAWFGNGARLIYILVVRFGGAVLANVLLWSGSALYPDYGPGEASHVISALADQGAAGVVMMIEQGLVTLGLFAWLFFRAARESEERQTLLDLATERGFALDEQRAARAVAAGQGDAYIGAGVEWVSRYNEAVEGARPQDQNERLQGKNGDPDAYIQMGLTAENVAERYEVSRADMDKYAQRSQELAVQSQDNGYFDREIVPVTLPDGTTVAKDDGPRPNSTLEKLAELDPAFKENGKVTAGNSCPLNDGAAAVLVMSDTKAKELGLEPRARILTAATAAIEPEYMGVAPIGAIRKVLDRGGMTIRDVDTVELNEAFAAQVIPIMDECDIPLEKLNPHGGAIALGHPFGMTGARIMTTLLNGLETDDKTIGLETMCVAGGQGQAMLVERLS